MTLKGPVDQYLQSLAAREYADSTIYARRRHLLEFVRWLEVEEIDVGEVNLPVLERYRLAVCERRRRDGGHFSWGSKAPHPAYR